MSLFPSTLTGRILDDGVTEPPVIELQGISAGQLATVLTAYTPLKTSTQHTADIGTNAAAIAALQGQVAALPAVPDLTPYALASDLAAAEGLIAANASGLTAVNTSLTQGLASKANQSALDALQVEVDGKSTPAGVDLKLSNHPTTAAMNSAVTSANNATLASIATTYALKSVVDQLALDVAARQTAADVAQAIATALLPMASTSDLTAAVALRTTPADVSQLIATALLPFVQQAAVDAALALRDSRLDGHDTEILALQNAGPFATAGDLNTLQLTLQSAIDGILAEISTLGGATNLVNAPAWLGNVTWDLLAGTNQIRNLHATGPLSIALANDDWTLSFGCDAYTTQQTDDAIAAALTDYFTRAEVTVTVVAAIDESKGYTDTQLSDYSTTAEMTQAITDALVPFETAAQRDAAIAAALAAYYTSAQTDAAIAAALVPYGTVAQRDAAIADALAPFETAVQRDAAIAAALAAYYTSAQTDAAIAAAIAPYYTSAETDAAIAAAVALSNGQSWTGGPTFNLLRGSNVLRNLSVAGALTASFQNLDDTILIESDSYARSETYTQLETGAAITAAIDALDLSQFQNEAEVLALIATALVPYWDQGEVSSFVAGELSNYATSSSVTSAISSALSSYDNSSQVDSKIITALLDFYTRAEVDQEIADALGNVDLSAYYTSAQTDSLFYPRAELDSQLTATFTQYWTSGRTQTEIDDAIAGAGFLTQAQADTRYFAVSANASPESLVRTNVTPPMIKALLPRAPLAASTILTDTTLELTCDAYSKAESDGRYLSSSSFAPLDARYFARNPSVAEGNGLFHLVQEQFTPQFIRSLLFRPPLTGRGILGNFSVIEVEADCWSKAQSDSRYPLVATFNSLGSTVTSIDGRVSTLESDVPAIDGRVTALENSGGVAPTADLTVNSLTARDFNVRDPRKLFQIARREFPDRRDLTSARAAAALRGDVARQILAPKPRSLGKSAAEGPNDRLQADLVDFSQNRRGRNKYGLVVQDVFTREIATKALPDKRAETVTRAAAEIIPDLVQEEGNYVVTTDLGNEFQGLEAALPGGAVHRQKDPSDRNATAVVDRAIQTLKKDLAGMVARRGGGWGEHVDEAAEAYNARPHQAVTVAPEDVETMPTATFRVYQDNATKFQHNKKLTEGRKRRLEEAGAFRAPTNARRSFEPQYGPAREIASIDSMVVRATDGAETLLKHALPVPRGSAEPKAKLTRPPVPLAIRQLQDFNPGPVAPP